MSCYKSPKELLAFAHERNFDPIADYIMAMWEDYDKTKTLMEYELLGFLAWHNFLSVIAGSYAVWEIKSSSNPEKKLFNMAYGEPYSEMLQYERKFVDDTHKVAINQKVIQLYEAYADTFSLGLKDMHRRDYFYVPVMDGATQSIYDRLRELWMLRKFSDATISTTGIRAIHDIDLEILAYLSFLENIGVEKDKISHEISALGHYFSSSSGMDVWLALKNAENRRDNRDWRKKERHALCSELMKIYSHPETFMKNKRIEHEG